MSLMNYIDLYASQLENMIYWTSKRSGVSVRFRAYKLRSINDTYSLLGSKPLAEIYVFLHKENHGSCIGMIKGGSIQHFKSKEEAFEKISNQIQENEKKRKDQEVSDLDPS